MYDSRTPAPGVRVEPMPRTKVHGLTAGQSRNMRALNFEQSVMRPRPMVQPVKTGGGGCPPSMVVARGDTRSRNHRRRSPKQRPQNRCFGPEIPSMHQSLHQEAADKVTQMRRIYRRCVRVARPDLDCAYECLRVSFYRLYREFFWMVREMEQQVEGENHA